MRSSGRLQQLVTSSVSSSVRPDTTLPLAIGNLSYQVRCVFLCSQQVLGNISNSFAGSSLHTTAACSISSQTASGSSSSTESSHSGLRHDSSASSASSSSTVAQQDRSSPHRTTQASTSSSRPPANLHHTSLDKKEAAKFAALADQWWDKTSGPFAPLHALNPARCRFLRQGVCSLHSLDHNSAEPLIGFSALDVGCGGGLLSEPVARLGAAVHGVDVSEEGVAAAAAHAAGDPVLQQRIRYQKATLEELVSSGASYDIVMASEVIEHVRKPNRFLADLAAVTKPGGHVFITTINRTPASYALAILGAEYVLGVVPRGTHDWGKFVTPQELALMAIDAGLRVELLAGMLLDAATGRFKLGVQTNVNYAALLSKQ